MVLTFSLTACDAERRKSDAELGLNAQQAAGRRVYDQECDRCHEAYSSRSKKADSLQGVFKKEYLRKSGLPANDERVGEIIRSGRTMMPGFGQVLSRAADSGFAGLHAHPVTRETDSVTLNYRSGEEIQRGDRARFHGNPA